LVDLNNPILVETKALYRFEYEIASEVVELMKEKTGISLPEREIGFIALHSHSGITNKTLSEVNKHSRLVSDLVEMVEEQFDIEIDKDSIDY
jgi:transcriptional antiterminator